jgi:hypothetical protein
MVHGEILSRGWTKIYYPQISRILRGVFFQIFRSLEFVLIGDICGSIFLQPLKSVPLREICGCFFLQNDGIDHGIAKISGKRIPGL